jgi:hypothetical protein
MPCLGSFSPQVSGAATAFRIFSEGVRPPSDSQNSPRRILAAERQTKALNLRKQGVTYAHIAEALGISEPRARRIVTFELQRLNQKRSEPAEVLRLEVERLDGMLAGIWPAAENGDVASIDRVLRIIERRAKLQAWPEAITAARSAAGHRLGKPTPRWYGTHCYD